jgi:hypothetical protein
VPIVDLPPPSEDVRDAVARLVMEIVARRTLVELGVICDTSTLVDGSSQSC